MDAAAGPSRGAGGLGNTQDWRALAPTRSLLALAAGLVLADAAIVTLALPELLVELQTTVEGVAAVIGVYTVVLAAALLPAEQLSRGGSDPAGSPPAASSSSPPPRWRAGPPTRSVRC